MGRPPIIRAAFDRSELYVDNFAGGGGTSTGLEAFRGQPVDIAINHNAAAIAMHRANHPETNHYTEDIYAVDPREACGGRPVGLAWFSPDCTHFSRAKGTTPLKKEIRGLAWVVIDWARAVRPRVIILENVAEFQTWGPLDDLGRPDKGHAGETFRAWLAELKDCGYEVDYRVLVAADYGTPTTRKRLFVVARCDGRPIVWPEASHGEGRIEPWRPAAEIIDWSLPCPSIFARTRPLADATMQRIAAGLRRYVLESPEPFIMSHYGQSVGRSIWQPLPTVTAGGGGHSVLIEPFIVRHGHYSHKSGAGIREGCGAGTFRGQPLALPLATVCATNDKHLVVPWAVKSFGGPAALHKQTPGTDVRSPLGTVTSRDHNNLAAVWLEKFYGTASRGASVREPLPTVTANGRGGGHIAEVRAFLMKYYGAEGRSQTQSLRSPVHTVTSKARFGLVIIEGEPYAIVDIGMRMLQPHELFAAQGFPEDYVITPEFNGKPMTKPLQIALAGNSVPPQLARATAAANLRRAA